MIEYLSFLLAIPVTLIFRKILDHESRISSNESDIENQDEKVKTFCDSNEALIAKVNLLIGRVDEHLRNSPK